MNNLREALFPMAAIALLCACGGDDGGATPDAGQIDSGQIDAGTMRNIVGTAMDSYLKADGTVTMTPTDLSAATIAAHVPNDNGEYMVIAGSGNADGTFAINGVATGDFLLQVGAAYQLTDSSTFDFGRNHLGRSDAESAGAGTTVTFNVDGLNNFNGETINLNSPDVQATAFALERLLEPALADGATSITGTLDWGDIILSGLVDGGKGDSVYLTTFTSAQLGNLSVRSISQFAEISGFTMVDAADTTLTGTLAATVNQTVAISIDPADWAPHFADFGPTDVVQPSLGFSTYINPSDQFGDLSLIELFEVSGITDEPIDEILSYANPFPADWDIAAGSGGLGIGFVDAARTTLGLSFIGSGGELTAFAGNVAPRLSLIKAPLVDGNDLMAQTSGPTPTISWTAPTLGISKFYFVSVRQMGVGTRGTLVATLGTSATSIVVPDGIMASGSSYFFEISAVDAGNDYNSAPFRGISFETANSRRPTAPLTVE